jgi:hypothetical protein
MHFIIDFENQQQYTFIPLTPSVLGIYNLKKQESGLIRTKV